MKNIRYYTYIFIGACLMSSLSHAQVSAAENLEAQLLAQVLQAQIESTLLETKQTSSADDTVSPKSQDESSATNNNLLGCLNTQIISYLPQAGAQQDSVSAIEYLVTADTLISSLEATINGEYRPVEYRMLADGSYEAKVRVPSYLEGDLYIALGAGSQQEGSCNDLLYTSIVSGDKGTYDQYGNKIGASSTGGYPAQTYTTAAEPYVATAQTNIELAAAGATQDDTSLAVVEETQQLVINEPASTPWWKQLYPFATASDQQAEQQKIEGVAHNVTADDAQQASTTNQIEAPDALQAATVLGAVGSGIGLGRSCNTVGAHMGWYVWLGLVWVWLVLVWVVVNQLIHRVAPEQYAQRLAWTSLAAVLFGSCVWWVVNPCLTHAWVPFSFVALGALTYWLYSEEEVIISS